MIESKSYSCEVFSSNGSKYTHCFLGDFINSNNLHPDILILAEILIIRSS